MSLDATQRFSTRVENYLRYRPGYPSEVIDTLRGKCGLGPSSVVADVGAGTGIFSKVLLENGNRVFSVEPNDAMRAAAERSLGVYPAFTSVSGTAEATTLPDHSVDCVTAAQAFHWFDRARARTEFERILKPGGWVALIWNDRQLDSTPFLRDYEELLRKYGTDYLAVRHKDLDLRQVREFIGSDDVGQTVVQSEQVFDLEGLSGRLLSSSYAPEAGQPDHAPMIADLVEIFVEHRTAEGTVSFRYDTRIFYAQLP